MVLDCNLCYAGICNRLAFFVPRQLSSTARAVCMPGYNARASGIGHVRHLALESRNIKQCVPSVPSAWHSKYKTSYHRVSTIFPCIICCWFLFTNFIIFSFSFIVDDSLLSSPMLYWVLAWPAAHDGSVCLLCIQYT